MIVGDCCLLLLLLLISYHCCYYCWMVVPLLLSIAAVLQSFVCSSSRRSRSVVVIVVIVVVVVVVVLHMLLHLMSHTTSLMLPRTSRHLHTLGLISIYAITTHTPHPAASPFSLLHKLQLLLSIISHLPTYTHTHQQDFLIDLQTLHSITPTELRTRLITTALSLSVILAKHLASLLYALLCNSRINGIRINEDQKQNEA